MNTERQKVTLTTDPGVLIKELFHKTVPDEFLVVLNRHIIDHHHSYGGVTPFFRGLIDGKLLGTQCHWIECMVDNDAKILLPPRADCPDCWNDMEWVEIDTSKATIYSYSVAEYSGAGAKGSLPWPLISVEIPGVWTKFMSYLAEFGENEPYIGMPIKPVFRRENPTYTILDIAWIPDDERIEKEEKKKTCCCSSCSCT
ncbi:MAG: hypothetical protein COU47_04405 [Candidatus Niyogibacteria bacterium CG10_big_fil_rev_8_21_14_0_10_46_36]|uniref:Uncharacterized protein n=1 Tax=Candidatus Niyogibacteria bacterium CG10_big_fil_rev_8_21_14_0_10_46_36 TaxID=1974726 RepID=A0A2H0TEQ4_9BACT|nr:MAG: hypothetical protein COU47_04405 [Candidatus Niyogibacteria bacterium CG10_big_fil_rev_8_21_14_0_10_46_36]